MSSGWELVTLDGTDWAPARLLASASWWPQSLQVFRLGDVAAVRALTAPLRAPLPLVTPADVDRASGAITPKRVVDDEGLVLGEDLIPTDVLVPAYGTGPCVRVSDDVRGLAFRGFLRVRPFEDRVASEWLWAFLSSVSGIRAREDVSAGSAVSRLTAAALSAVRLPLLGIEHARRGGFATHLPHRLVVESEGGALRSSWSFRDLREGAAWAGSEPSEEQPVGVELSELGDVWSGTVDLRDAFACPGPGRTRVLTHRAVRGHREPCEMWGEGRRVTTSESVVFTRTEPFRVTHAPAGVLLAKELVALDLARVTVAGSGVGPAEGLASYFTHGDGRRVLALVSAGTVVTHLSPSVLRRIRVPETALISQSDRPSASLLAERLEVALRGAIA
jgi:hypothetical protein